MERSIDDADCTFLPEGDGPKLIKPQPLPFILLLY